MTAMFLAMVVMGGAQTRTQEVGFDGAAGLKMSGELMLPEGAGPFPCVLMMPGSGPTDRDGNQPPQLTTDVLKQIAQHLANNGIASYRFDKRPVHKYASQWPKATDVEAFSEYFSFENHIFDVEAAYKTMLAQKGVDPKRCALLGHSEGGLFACWVAHTLKPAAVVLIGTAGTSMVEVLRYQIGNNVNASTLPAERKKAVLDSNEKTMAAIIATGKLPDDVDPVLKPLYAPTALKLLRSYLTIDPTVPLAQYAGPVLVLNGEKDVQVRADWDAPKLMKALQGRKGGVQELYVVPGASHCLKSPVEGDPMSAFTGPVVPNALGRISSWLRANLK